MKMCSVDACPFPAYALGLCMKHYTRQYRTGTTDKKSTAFEWLSQQVVAKNRDECWDWPYTCRTISYCGSYISAKKISLLLDGKVPEIEDKQDGTVKIIKICESDFCVNPDHLNWPLNHCIIENCPNPVRSRNMCLAHYLNWRYYDSPSIKQDNANRRAIRQEAHVQDIDRDLLFDVYNGCCYLCGEELNSQDDWDLEHMQPLSKGGKHAYHNVAPAHDSCNSQKQSRTVMEYLMSGAM